MKLLKMLTINFLVVFLCIGLFLLVVACANEKGESAKIDSSNSSNDSKEIAMPSKMLKDYTLKDLQEAVKNLSDKNTLENFRFFMVNGITTDGSDNATKQIEDNHWAIDDNGKTASEDGFGINANVYEFRIIGINQDGEGTLSFMATNCLEQTCKLEEQEHEGYKYG